MTFMVCGVEVEEVLVVAVPVPGFAGSRFRYTVCFTSRSCDRRRSVAARSLIRG